MSYPRISCIASTAADRALQSSTAAELEIVQIYIFVDELTQSIWMLGSVKHGMTHITR